MTAGVASLRVLCPCGSRMELRNSRFGRFWGCLRWPDCDGTVGTHPDGRPLGRPGTKADRDARMRAHDAFDPLWREAPRLYGYAAEHRAPVRLRKTARHRAYAWLAEQLGLDVDHCHIGLFDVGECERVVEACRGVTAADIRAWAHERRARA